MQAFAAKILCASLMLVSDIFLYSCRKFWAAEPISEVTELTLSMGILEASPASEFLAVLNVSLFYLSTKT